MMITKTKKMNNEMVKAIERSEKIKTIPNYEQRFTPIEKYKELTIKNMKTGKETKTNMITCYQRNSGNKTMREYIYEKIETDNQHIIEILDGLEQYLLESIRLSNKANVPMWNNMSEETIMMDSTNAVLLTDFVPREDIDPTTSYSVLYPIEYYTMMFKEETMTNEGREKIFNAFIENKELFHKKYQKITDTELIDMKERYNCYMATLQHKPTSFPTKKWGTYMLAVAFLTILTDIDIDERNITPELEMWIEKQKKKVLSFS